MSCYFQVGDEEVWNPSNSLARTFLGQAGVLSRLVGHDSGLGEIIEDECEIDPARFVTFIDALVSLYQKTNNVALQSLLKGFIAVALVLVDRLGETLPSISPEFSAMWVSERDAQARSMPTG